MVNMPGKEGALSPFFLHTHTHKQTLELTAEDRVLLHEGALTLRLHNKKTIGNYR